MAQPLISVVIPVFNGEDYIKSALQSVLAQDVNLEVIISDDCSRDSTLQIVHSFNDKRITVLTSAANGGQFVNFNRALAAAKGDYIQLFSHDDVAHPGFLQSQKDRFDTDGKIGLVYSSCNIIDEYGELKAVVDDDGTPIIIDFKTYLYISSRHGSLPPSISSVMISRKVFETVGGFDERYAVAGDLEFFNRVAHRFIFARNRDLLLDVRTHSGSVTMNRDSPLRYMAEENLLLPYYRDHLGEASYRNMMRRRAYTRGADHARHLAKLASKGDWKRFRLGWRELSKAHNIPASLLYSALRLKPPKSLE